MKPYGKKNEKSSLSIHSADDCSTCSNVEWKVSKSRERGKNGLPDFDEIIDDIQYLEMRPNSEESHWISCYQPLGISIIGKTKEDTLNGIREAYNTHL